MSTGVTLRIGDLKHWINEKEKDNFDDARKVEMKKKKNSTFTPVCRRRKKEESP